MPERAFDLVVVGAGPAGASAAVEARRHGLSVAVLDENRAAGGQVFRAPMFPGVAVGPSPDADEGARLRDDLDRSGADVFLGHMVWNVAPGGAVSAIDRRGASEFRGRLVLLATGTTEKVVPVPGLTTPGVIGLAAATVALKSHGAVPPGPTVVAGVGPLVYAVAAGILKTGGRVAAALDLARPADWLAVLPSLAVRPDLLSRGFGWAIALRRAGVPLLFGHTVTAIEGGDAVREVVVRRVRNDWSPDPSDPGRRITAGGVAIGHGLVPAIEPARLLAVPHDYRPERGGWVPRVREDRTTDVPAVLVAGDCAGVSGAAAAVLAGRLAGLTAAREAGALDAAAWAERAAPVRAALGWAERFGWAISALMRTRPGLVGAVAADTVVCRCEDVTRSAIEEALRRGAVHVNQIKSATRCGMGPCQGRMCGETVAQIVADATNRPRADAGHWTARTPLRTVPLERLLGAYAYEDIPRPPPQPG
jgi:thioredoxin reductase/bacterioferritin-associated ferredoxin